MKYNLPNLLTLSRIPMMFVVVALLNQEYPWSATICFWLYIAAALTDWLDGKIARERGEVSPFGRFMDAVIDKVMVIGIMIALVGGNYFLGHNIAATMLLLCILAREFAVSGMRMAAASKGIVVEADAGGKVKTFVQFNAIGWLIGWRMFAQDYPELFRGDEARITGVVHAVGISLFVLSAVLTVTSGWSYFRRHGHVVMT
ncbi:MAG: CDP-diacylglycerol--glycerol-3-phosphate 3-phosphatidyltransferase [Verrucomicrobiota bacterium]|nr:CDP-diacylglycerol--glycerol-3-phosphate 3-phosphatidyltransferase [Opitutales bacterium]